MTKYEKQILDCLIDKYENSKSFIGANLVRQSFSKDIGKLYPKYGDDSEYDLFCEINESISLLEAHNFVIVSRRKNGVVQSVKLNVDLLEKIYIYAKRTPKKNINYELYRLLVMYKDCNDILLRYCNAQTERLEKNKSVEYFDGDFVVYESILKVVSKITDVKCETFERDFSMRVLGDSKAFEKIKNKVVSLLFDYGNFSEKESLLADLNVIKNPGHVFVKGNGAISIEGQKVNLSKIRGDIAISSEILNSIDKIEIFGNTVITIENLTTFNSFCCRDSFAIYLGGYHNTNRRNFIKKVYALNPGKRYLHFGDIDAGGFYILKHLRRMTDVDFIPYRMDVSTLEKNRNLTKRLTDNDRSRLKNLLDTEFKEVINFMLDNNCKLEQEAIDIFGIGI